ncbi:MAG: hypothetical protein D4R64_14875 [Porphyromonadaceae bacterium]|nr:MAG: hypothetical protein D4R64_14875 [Porphyromonadaceae bacterium]
MYKKSSITSGLIALLSLVMLTNCETDFNPGMPDQDIPVIYGLIDYDDQEYQVSVTKTFLPDGPGNAGIGSGTDLYYDSLNVALELRFDPEARVYSSSYGWEQWLTDYQHYGELIIRKEMRPKQIVDPTEGRSRKVYTLPASEFVKYGLYGVGALNPLILRLVVQQPGTDIYAVASTRICERPYLMSLGKATSMSLYNNLVEWSWDSHGNYNEPKITLHYQELQNGEWLEKQLTWSFSPFEEKVFIGDRGSKFTYYSGLPFTESILTHIGGRIKPNPEVEARKLISYDLVVFNADPIFGQYLESDKIVSDQIGKPISNVINGLGIFASTSKNGQYGFTLDKNSLDSLVYGRYTKHLKFVKW